MSYISSIEMEHPTRGYGNLDVLESLSPWERFDATQTFRVTVFNRFLHVLDHLWKRSNKNRGKYQEKLSALCISPDSWWTQEATAIVKTNPNIESVFVMSFEKYIETKFSHDMKKFKLDVNLPDFSVITKMLYTKMIIQCSHTHILDEPYASKLKFFTDALRNTFEDIISNPNYFGKTEVEIDVVDDTTVLQRKPEEEMEQEQKAEVDIEALRTKITEELLQQPPKPEPSSPPKLASDPPMAVVAPEPLRTSLPSSFMPYKPAPAPSSVSSGSSFTLDSNKFGMVSPAPSNVSRSSVTLKSSLLRKQQPSVVNLFIDSIAKAPTPTSASSVTLNEMILEDVKPDDSASQIEVAFKPVPKPNETITENTLVKENLAKLPTENGLQSSISRLSMHPPISTPTLDTPRSTSPHEFST
jgi:hypothetical protein